MFAKGADERVEASTVFGRKRDSNVELLQSKTLLEVVPTWLSAVYFRYRDAESAVAHFHGEATSPLANDSGASATFPKYYVNLDKGARWDLAYLDEAVELLERTVLKTKTKDVQETCPPDDVKGPSSMIDVALSVVGRVSDPVAGDFSSNDLLPRATEVFQPQMKYDRLTAQMNSVTSECCAWHSAARERGDDIISFRGLPVASDDKTMFLEGPTAAVQQGKETVDFK